MHAEAKVVEFDMNGKRVRANVVRFNRKTVIVRVPYKYKRKRSLGLSPTFDKTGAFVGLKHNGYVMQTFSGTQEIVRHFRKHNVRGL